MKGCYLIQLLSSLRFLAFLTAGCLAGCSSAAQSSAEVPDITEVTSATTMPADSDLAVLEVAFRYELESASHDTPIFLSLTPISEHPVDPPAALFARLSNLQLDLRPASRSEHPGYREIVDRTTGKQGEINWVQIKERISDRKVKLAVGYWCGPLCGGGEEMMLELKDGAWTRIFTGTLRMWVN